jgi:hypothetical protein
VGCVRLACSAPLKNTADPVDVRLYEVAVSATQYRLVISPCHCGTFSDGHAVGICTVIQGTRNTCQSHLMSQDLF